MPILRLPVLLLAATSTVAGAQTTAPPRPEASNPAAADDAVTIARMLRARTDLSWLMSPADAATIRYSSGQRAEAEQAIALARVARHRGLDGSPGVIAARRVLDTVVLAEAARRDLEAGSPISDADVAATIRARPGRYDEYRIAHIFVAVGKLPGGGQRSDAEALLKINAIRDRLGRGEAFAALAGAASDDSETAGEGGMLPAMFGVHMADLFFPSVATLAVDAVAGPVRGDLGYHLIRLDHRTPATVRSARYLVEKDIRAERMPGIVAAAIRAADAR